MRLLQQYTANYETKIHPAAGWIFDRPIVLYKNAQTKAVNPNITVDGGKRTNQQDCTKMI